MHVSNDNKTHIDGASLHHFSRFNFTHSQCFDRFCRLPNDTNHRSGNRNSSLTFEQNGNRMRSFYESNHWLPVPDCRAVACAPCGEGLTWTERVNFVREWPISMHSHYQTDFFLTHSILWCFKFWRQFATFAFSPHSVSIAPEMSSWFPYLFDYRLMIYVCIIHIYRNFKLHVECLDRCRRHFK